MASCSAFGCSNRSFRKSKEQLGKENLIKITFHRFPKDQTRRDKWIAAVRRKNWKPSSCSVLCSQHFTDDCFDKTSLCVVRLREHAVPSIFSGFPVSLRKVGLKCPIDEADSDDPTLVHKYAPNRCTETKNEPVSSSAGQSRKINSGSNTRTQRKKAPSSVSACLPAEPITSDMENLHPGVCEATQFLGDSGSNVFERLLRNANRLSLPFGWARNIPIVGPRAIIYTQFTSLLADGRVLSVIHKQVCVDERGHVTCYVLGRRVCDDILPVQNETLQSKEQLQELLVWFDLANVCEGAENGDMMRKLDSSGSCPSGSRGDDCELIVRQGWKCRPCSQLYNSPRLGRNSALVTSR